MILHLGSGPPVVLEPVKTLSVWSAAENAFELSHEILVLII